MSPADKELRAMFARLEDRRFREWVRTQHEACVKYLMQSTDTVALYRAQGRAALLAEIASHIDNSRS